MRISSLAPCVVIERALLRQVWEGMQETLAVNLDLELFLVVSLLCSKLTRVKLDAGSLNAAHSLATARA